MTGFKKVSHKARRNRKRQPQRHKQHRRPGAISDPITRAKKRVMLEKRAEAERRAEEALPNAYDPSTWRPWPHRCLSCDGACAPFRLVCSLCRPVRLDGLSDDA